MGQPARAPRALYCTDTFPPQLNGVSVVTALSVAGLRARGWDVSVIAPRYPAASPGGPTPLTMPQGGPGEQHAVASVPLPFYPDLRLSFPRAAAVGEVLDRFRPDIVHCATEFVIGRVGQAAAIARGIPVVSSYHTDFSRYAAEYGFPMLREPVRRYLARFHRRARRTYTPGHPARQELLALQVEDVEVWGRGVDAELFTRGTVMRPSGDRSGRNTPLSCSMSGGWRRRRVSSG